MPRRSRARLDALAAELDGDLEPIAGKPYIVFHDAFQYLERRYGLNVVGSISINPEVPPSAKRLTDLRRKIQSLGAVCVFAEPAFDTAPRRQPDRGHQRPHRHARRRGRQPGPGPRALFHADAQAGGRISKGCLGAAA